MKISCEFRSLLLFLFLNRETILDKGFYKKNEKWYD